MKLQGKAVLFFNACVLVACVLLTAFGWMAANRGFDQAMEQQSDSCLQSALEIIDARYPGAWEVRDGALYKGGVDVGSDGALCDHLAELAHGYFTLFAGDTVVSTNVLREDGTRDVGGKIVDLAIGEKVIDHGQAWRGVIKIFDKDYSSVYLPIKDAGGKVIGMSFVGMDVAGMNATRHTFLVGSILVMLVVLALFGVVSYLVIGRNIRPLEQLTRNLHQIAGGDLRVADLSEVRGDELGALAGSANHMKQKLTESMTEINMAAEQVAAGAKNVEDASTALSTGAAEQASSVEQLSSSISEIASQTALTAEHAAKANELVQQAKAQADKSGTDMQDMLSAMDAIGEASGNIEKIIKVIDDIAFQTNILALNAAVEAAHAGAHGKGFAVVAEEVKNLAARSTQAASETTDLIEDSVAKVKDGKAVARRTAETLAAITDEVESVSGLTSGIAKAAGEQKIAIEQIDQGVQQVSQVVQANSSTSEEAASAAEELSAQAARMKETVGQFKVH